MRLFFIWCATAIALASGASLHAAGNPIRTSEVTSACNEIVNRLPGVKKGTCDRAALHASGAKSAQGRPILMRRIPANIVEKQEAPAIRVMLIGGIHGDELSSSSIVFHWMDLIQRPSAQHFEWIVAPVVNPDGLLARKPSRVNANGVDLNRNFPTPDWQKEALRYWASRTGSDPRRYPGRTPLSEPESRWVNDQLQQFRPDVIISVHAPYGVLDFDGNGQPPYRFGRLPLNKVGIYPGSLGNYGGVHRNVPVITIELPNALSIPPEQEIERIWLDMLNYIAEKVGPVSSRTEQQANPAAPSSPPSLPKPPATAASPPAPPMSATSPAPDSTARRTVAN